MDATDIHGRERGFDKLENENGKVILPGPSGDNAAIGSSWWELGLVSPRIPDWDTARLSGVNLALTGWKTEVWTKELPNILNLDELNDR